MAAPAYARGAGPVVLVDEAHANFHTIGGRYGPFRRLLEADGYVVRANRAPFSAESLRGASVLVIANALHPDNAASWRLPTPSAFTAAEVAAVHEWVQGGGALVLIADHMPFPGAAGPLAAAFGVDFRNGFAFDSTERNGRTVFRRSDGTLASHPVTQGRGAAERIDSIVSFTGQGFVARGEAEPLLVLPAGTVLLLPDEAWRFSAATRRERGRFLQGALLRVGRGRAAFFGEAAMFTTQVAGAGGMRVGMNAPGAEQNAQFALNLLHCLTDVLHC